MEQVNEQLGRLSEASVASLRSKLNQMLNGLGLITASGSASLLSSIIIAVIVCNIFFALNIGVGLLLGEQLGSLGLGFIALMVIYLIILLVYMGYKKHLEQKVKDRVARQVHHLTDDINLELNSLRVLQVSPAYQEAYISSEPFPFQALKLRRDEAIKQKERAQTELKKGTEYILNNYQALFGAVLNHSVPAYRYISPVIDLLGSKREKKVSKVNKQAPIWLKYLNQNSAIGKSIRFVEPYMPFVGMVYSFIRPIATTVILSKTQSWILRKLLGSSKRKRY